jgi:hypothetical protein
VVGILDQAVSYREYSERFKQLFANGFSSVISISVAFTFTGCPNFSLLHPQISNLKRPHPSKLLQTIREGESIIHFELLEEVQTSV